MPSHPAGLAPVVLAAVLAGCAVGQDEPTNLADALRQPLTHAYGPIESLTCQKNDEVTLPTGSTAYDCTAQLRSGSRQPLCAGFATGVPAFEHTTCAESGFPRR